MKKYIIMVWHKTEGSNTPRSMSFIFLQQNSTTIALSWTMLTLLLWNAIFITTPLVAQVCPFSDYVIGNIETLCGGDLPNLPVAGNGFTIDDPDNTQVGIMQWFQDELPANGNTYNLQAFFHSGNNICQPDPVQTLYAFVRCDSDADGEGDEWILVAQHSFQIYPDAQAPTIVQNDDICTYTILPACENDQISPSILDDLPPGTGQGNIAITVVPTSPICPTETFTVSYAACALLPCVTSDFVDAGVIPLCEGDVPTLPEAGVDFNLSNTESQVGAVFWYDEIASPYTPEPVIHLGNDCLPNEVMTLMALVGCDGNLDGVMDELVVVASYQYQVYPTPQAPTIQRIDDLCNYELVPACNNDILEPTTVPMQAPGSGVGFHTITVSSGLLNAPCLGLDFDVAYAPCPEKACPTAGFFQAVQESLCDGETPSLPQAGLDFEINDPDGAQNGAVVWLDGINPNTANTFTPMPVFHSGNDLCVADDLQTVYAFVQCDVDADNNTDLWIQVAAHQFRVFPEPQMPSISQTDLECNYSIMPFCATDQLSRNDFQLAPGAGVDTLSVEVVSGLLEGVCAAQNFELLASSCPLPDNALVAPNSFSPNGDGMNDVFRVMGANIAEVDLHVYNRWGETIFAQQGDDTTAWDGQQSDQTLADVGVYAFYALVTFLDGEVRLVRGGINLIR